MKSSNKAKKAAPKKAHKGGDTEELRKPSKLTPIKVKGKGKENKNWKAQLNEDEDEVDVPLDEDFKGFDDLYSDVDEDEEEDF